MSDEARLRRAAMDALDARTRPKQDNPHLVDLAATSSTRQVKFLALLVLGLGAERRSDLSAARTRYDAARDIGPDWLSAQHALASILLQQGQTALARDSLPAAHRPDASDPWYGYPCQIITPAVLAELRERQAKVKRP